MDCGAGWIGVWPKERAMMLKRAGMAILISDKIDFKSKAVTRDKEGHCIMINGSIHQEDIEIINIYAPTSELLNI